MLVTDFDFDRARTQALAQAEQMLGNDLYSRFKLSREKRLEKAMLGTLGELAFEHMLVQYNIAFERDTSDFSKVRTDQFDFKISYNADRKHHKHRRPGTATSPQNHRLISGPMGTRWIRTPLPRTTSLLVGSIWSESVQGSMDTSVEEPLRGFRR